jgi:excisionase family DNA binding protein
VSAAPLLNLDALRELVREEVAAALATAKPLPVEKQVLNLSEVSALLGLSRKTVAKFIREEGLPHTPYGRVSRFDRTAVLAWNAARGSKT